MKRAFYALLILLPMSFQLQAEVINSSEHGFTLRIEKTVNSDAMTAYRQFIRIGEWWDAEHTWFGEAENLSLEPRAGGCFCEKSAGREVLHMTVTYVDPGREVRMTGGLGPLQMMGVHGGWSWQFSALPDDTTKIILNYQVVGFLADGLDSLAAVVDGVQTSQVERLVSVIEQTRQ